MATYKVVAFCACSGCHDVHEVGIHLSLDNGPANRQCVGDLYKGKALPPELIRLDETYIPCPRTGRYFSQTDTFQCFLIPVSGDDRPQDHNHQRKGRSNHGLVRQ